MKKYFIGIITAFILSAGFVASSNAGVLNISGAAGTIMPPYNNCSYTSIEAPIGNATCMIRFAIPLEPGRTISSVYFYFFDNPVTPPVNSQYIRARVIRYDLSLMSNQKVFDQTDTTPAASVQYISATVNKTIGTYEVFYADVLLDFGTQIRGIRVNYY